MRYFSIRAACGTQETGRGYPQINGMNQEYDFNKSNSITRIKIGKVPSKNPNFDYFILKNKSKFTDILSAWFLNDGLIISKRFKEILEKFDLQDHRFYPAKVAKHNEKRNYYWFLPLDDLSSKVDYQSTEFYAIDSFGKIDQVLVNSIDDINFSS